MFLENESYLQFLNDSVSRFPLYW